MPRIEDVTKAMVMLDRAYPDRRGAIDKEMIATWHGALYNYSTAAVMNAAVQMVRSCDRWPSLNAMLAEVRVQERRQDERLTGERRSAAGELEPPDPIDERAAARQWIAKIREDLNA